MKIISNIIAISMLSLFVVSVSKPMEAPTEQIAENALPTVILRSVDNQVTDFPLWLSIDDKFIQTIESGQKADINRPYTNILMPYNVSMQNPSGMPIRPDIVFSPDKKQIKVALFPNIESEFVDFKPGDKLFVDITFGENLTKDSKITLSKE